MELSDFFALLETFNDKERRIIAIDGGSGSGKSTVASEIADKFGFTVFHADDYFLPPELRTEERLSEVGGNFHRERFRDEILLPLSENKPVAYRPFDCKTKSLKPCVTVNPTPTVIVEGSYSLHPEIEDFYYAKVFFDIDKDEQRRRILARNGDGAERFFSLWIPYEN